MCLSGWHALGGGEGKGFGVNHVFAEGGQLVMSVEGRAFKDQLA